MRYVKNVDIPTYVGEIPRNGDIPNGFIEISKEEYDRLQLMVLTLDDINDGDVTWLN